MGRIKGSADGLDHRDLYLLIQRACAILWSNVPKDGKPYFGAFSGGKDSVVIKELARLAKVPVEWHYHVTTIDPPELVRFIREEHPDVVMDNPRLGGFFSLFLRYGFPSRRSRWCCKALKEGIYNHRTAIVGIRIAESVSRRNRWTSCVRKKDNQDVVYVSPIRLWPDDKVWEFIRGRGIPYCSLYDEGFERLGCIGCPMGSANHRKAQFDRWPRFERLWRRSFEELWKRKAGTPNRNGAEWWSSRVFGSWEQLFKWWNDGQQNVTLWKRKNGLRANQRIVGRRK